MPSKDKPLSEMNPEEYEHVRSEAPPPTKYETTSLLLSGDDGADLHMLQRETEQRASRGWVLAGSFAVPVAGFGGRVYRTWAHWEHD